MAKKPVVLSFWKFNPDAAATTDDALVKAHNLQHHVPPASWGERFFKWQGWEFDIGRKPYLIDTDGMLARVWGRSVDDVRLSLGLSRKTRVAADPFKARG